MKSTITNEYIKLWIEQAERQKAYNSSDSVSVSLDEWLSMLRELRALRRKNRSAP